MRSWSLPQAVKYRQRSLFVVNSLIINIHSFRLLLELLLLLFHEDLLVLLVGHAVVFAESFRLLQLHVQAI